MRRVICPSSAFHKAAMLCVLAVKYFLMLLSIQYIVRSDEAQNAFCYRSKFL